MVYGILYCFQVHGRKLSVSQLFRGMPLCHRSEKRKCLGRKRSPGPLLLWHHYRRSNQHRLRLPARRQQQRPPNRPSRREDKRDDALILARGGYLRLPPCACRLAHLLKVPTVAGAAVVAIQTAVAVVVRRVRLARMEIMVAPQEPKVSCLGLLASELLVKLRVPPLLQLLRLPPRLPPLPQLLRAVLLCPLPALLRQ